MDTSSDAAATLLYIQKITYKMVMVLLIVGALNWGLIGAFGPKWNLVDKLFGARTPISRIIYVIVGIAALSVMFCRNFYLPFLGETVLPCASLQEKTPSGANVEVRVNVPPHSKVLYWAAEPDTEHLKTANDWRKAYLGFENAGVTLAGADGIAVLKVRDPQPYTVPLKGRIEPHIHFRICGASGILGRVKTAYVKGGQVDGFELVRWG